MGKVRYLRVAVVPIVLWDDGEHLEEIKVDPIVVTEKDFEKTFIEGGLKEDFAILTQAIESQRNKE